MTWLAELKPNTALNHRGVVDGSRERKGARRQRFLIQINTEPRLSLLSNIDCSNSQWLFQQSLGKRLLQIHVPSFFFHTLQTFFLISYFHLRARFCYSSIPLASRFSAAIFSQPLHWQSPIPPPPLVTGELILSCTKNVRHGLPSSRPPVN